MEDVFPRMRSSVTRAFNIEVRLCSQAVLRQARATDAHECDAQPKPPTPQDLARDAAELRQLAALFSEPGPDDVDAVATSPTGSKQPAKDV